MSQKEFSRRTGIAESSISDWKRKKTNPVSEKILIICEVLDVTPCELFGGTDGEGRKSIPSQVIIVNRDSELGEFLTDYMKLDKNRQGRLIGYLKVLKELKRE